MAKLYGTEWTRAELTNRVGDISQIAGVRRSVLVEGKEKGVEVVDIRTGGGLAFTVVPSRALDIASADYRGVPLAWRSSAGVVAPEYYDEKGLGWRKNFFGGLLTTCGLANVGTPNVDDGEELGHHGRISNQPARNVHADARWEGNQLVMVAQGQMRDTNPRKYDFMMTRNVTAKLGENRLFISDVVENVGSTESPFMFLYHINVGFPVVDEGSELIVPVHKTTPRDAEAEAGINDRFRFHAPVAGYKEQVFYHDVVEDENRHAWVGLVNKRFNDGHGIGLYVKYHKSQFPNLVQWKMMSEGTYVVGIEPANCHVEGRARERERGTLHFIESGGRRHFETEIGVLTNLHEIEAFEEKVARTRSRQSQA